MHLILIRSQHGSCAAAGSIVDTFRPGYTKLEVVCQLFHTLQEKALKFPAFYVALQQLFTKRYVVIKSIRQHSHIL